MSFTNHQTVVGQLVTHEEMDCLRVLADANLSAGMVGDKLKSLRKPPGWTALRMLDSLQHRGLVSHYTTTVGDMTCVMWRLTAPTRAGLTKAPA